MAYTIDGEQTLDTGTVIVPQGTTVVATIGGMDVRLDFSPIGDSSVDGETSPAIVKFSLGDATLGASLTFPDFMKMTSGHRANVTFTVHTIGNAPNSVQLVHYVLYRA